MIKFATFTILCAASVFGADPSYVLPRTAESPAKSITKPGKTLWIASLAALGACTALDASSSFGRRESNPVLASQGRVFGWQNAGVKLGIEIPVVAFQLWQHKRHGDRAAYRTNAIVNFAAAGAFAAATAHNYGVKPVR